MPVRTSDVVTAETASVTFDDFLLKPALLKALKEFRYDHPSPVQLKIIPKALEGRDLLVQAKSGTGKTLAFGLVLLQQLENDHTALVLAPTREIAIQTEDEIARAGWHLEPKISVKSFVGGTPETSDAEKCKDCQIFVGTPGRILKLLRRKYIPTPFRFLVLDEADKLLEESFREPLTGIVEHMQVTEFTQLLAVSATFPPPLVLLAEKLLQVADGSTPRLLPEKVFLCSSTQIKGSAPTAVLQGVKQCRFEVPGYHTKQKVEPLFQVLSCVPFHQCIVFLNNPTQATQVAEMLNAMGVAAIATSGKQDQSWRRAALVGLKRFQYRAVVASDLWARGIDVSKVDLVVNLDLPVDKETYLHRVGRCGRFGASGLFVNIIFHEEVEHIEYFQAQLGFDLTDWNENKDSVIADLAWKTEAATETDNVEKETSIPQDTFDLKERRIDPEDGCEYYIEDFIAQYGGSINEPPAEWLHAQPEIHYHTDKRVDAADGNLYTIQDFILEYGGSESDPPEQWTSAVNPFEQRYDYDNKAYTLIDFVKAYGGSFLDPPAQWKEAKSDPAPAKNKTRIKKKKSKLEETSTAKTTECIPEEKKSKPVEISTAKTRECIPEAVKPNVRESSKLTLWQLFPPPPLPAALVPPGSGIPAYESWMDSCTEYTDYAAKIRSLTPLSHLWETHRATWGKN